MATEVLMPKLGLTMTEGTVQEWYKKEGDPVKKGEVICLIASEKLTMEVEAEADGFLTKIIAEVDEDIPVKGLIGIISETADEPISAVVPEKVIHEIVLPKVENIGQQETSKRLEGERIFASPLAKRLAKEYGIELQFVRGTGGNGRITKRDIERVLDQGLDDTIEIKVASIPEEKQVEKLEAAELNVGEGLEGMRKVIAQRMHNSITSTAQLTLHRKASLDKLTKFRNKLKDKLQQANIEIPITYTVFVARAVALALKKNPQMNSTYSNGSYIEHNEVHLGIATSVRNGLIVPVVENVDMLTLSSIAEEIATVTEKARNGESGAYLTGSTFTITNLGTSGVEYFTPILNTPETGILGLGTLVKEVNINKKGKPYYEQKMPLSLTFDHQIIDGSEAAAFLADVVYYLENPMLLVI
ncbi:dihydrolipoamide acetyltransferase family protein [Rummeliibacillus sp. POC4]|uniref:dihydrolipoamide acetyltransferase family protein n=1 Tax=Rummeliibacillus sp. POC4 TaxID=2305899 RepID=UPI000E65EB90|nr:dihydrolipoamide acetyltransferase family protein [Rummeliibacillus sp. POC4]RIJ63567.1 2-oxo acid dehydrogenase subunit E2 [Rummeliibacillus sp. POC4]